MHLHSARPNRPAPSLAMPAMRHALRGLPALTARARRPLATARALCPWMRALAAALAVAMIAAAGGTVAAAERPLAFGIFPNLTARQTIEMYRPLADRLEKQLGKTIVIYGARDFNAFVERTRQGDYDILLTAPHLAWLARQDAGYRPLLKYARPVRGLLVVRADAPYDAPEDLRGQTVATADPIAVAVLAVRAELAAHGLKHNLDYRSVDAGTHVNAAMQVLSGRTDAAILGLYPYLMLAPDVRSQLRVLLETPPLSSLMFLTHPRLRDREAAAIRKGLLAFAATPEGAEFMRRGGFGGLVPIDGTELRAFRPYALQAQQLLRDKR